MTGYWLKLQPCHYGSSFGITGVWRNKESTTEIDLSTITTSFGVINSTNFSDILMSRFSDSSINELIQDILICNYLGWETKLPQLYQVLANKLCGEKQYKRINLNHCSLMVVDNGNNGDNARSSDVTDSIKVLWRLRVDRYGQPDTVELRELQYVWWRMMADPARVLKTLNSSLSTLADSDSDGISPDSPKLAVLGKLEDDNIKGILLYCHQPLYFGVQAQDKAEWFSRQRDLHLLIPFHRAAGVFNTFVSHDGEIHLNDDLIQTLGSMSHNETVQQYNEIMMTSSGRHQALLKLLYLSIVASWAAAVLRASHSNDKTDDKYACDPNFDVDLYMLRFPEPTDFARYTDIVNPELENSVESLIEATTYILENSKLPLLEIASDSWSRGYQRDIERLENARKAKGITRLPRANTIKYRMGLKLNSDSQLQQLCQQHNILIVKYERDLTIKVLSNYTHITTEDII